MLQSKGRSILRDGIKMRPYQRIGELKLVQMGGQLIRLDSVGFKISLFQLQMVAIQLEYTISWFLMAMEAI